jgi:hypothetical protein
MSASSLEAARNALSQLLSLTDEEGSPVGPTTEGDLNGELSALPPSSNRAAIEDVYNRIRTALGLEEMPEGSVSFFKRLEDGEEEYHLRYNLSPAGKTGREERIIGQVDVGTVFILARRLPAGGDGNEGPSDDQERLTAEVDQSRELESGAKVTTETTWKNGQLGPVELGTIEAFFVPAVDLLEREDE